MLNLFLPKKTWIWIPIFYSIYLIYLWLMGQDLELFRFPEETISSATLHKIDISLRVSILYKAIGLILVMFFFFSLIFNICDKYLDRFSLILLNYISFFTLLLLAIQFLNGQNKLLLDVLLVSQLVIVFQSFLFKVFRDLEKFPFKKELFIWSFFISMSLIFLIRDIYSFNDIEFSIPVYYKYYFLLNLIIINAVLLLNRNGNISVNQIFKSSKPLIWLPIVSIVVCEMPIIFVNRGVNFLSSEALYLIFLLMLVTWSILLYYSKSNKVYNFKRDLGLYFSPIFLLGIISFNGYQPIIEQSKDIFELANPANALMRIVKFGEIPIVDFLSSHMLYEQIFPLLYTLINGYNGTIDFILYNFLLVTLTTLFTYYFFLFAFKNYILAIVMVLAFPYLGNIISPPQAIIFPSIILAYQLLNKFSFFRLLLMFIWTIFLCAWKVEVGLANFYAASLFLIFYLITNFKRDVILTYLKVLGLITAFAFVVLLVIMAVSDSDIIINVKKALLYFSANQAHGLKELTLFDGRYFKYHYFIFPIVVIFSTLAVLFISQKKKLWNLNKSLILSILYLVVVYFITAQRGLVRHNMINSSGWFSNSLFLILGLMVFFFLRNNKIKNQQSLFVIFSFLLVSNFKFPEKMDCTSNSELFIRKIVNFDKIWVKPNPNKIHRIVDKDNFVENNFGSIIEFLDSNTDNTQTFYDFSNTPMLYYYTQRKVPSYFNQIPICVINSSLQELHLADISKFDMPVMFFSNVPNTYWDHVDGVPNELRHSKITPWIYKNYSPYAIINNHTVWLRNEDAKLIEDGNEKVLIDVVNNTKEVKLKNLNLDLKKYNAVRFTSNKHIVNLPILRINGQDCQSHRINSAGYFEVLLPDTYKNDLLTIEYDKLINKLQIVELKYCPDTVSYTTKQYKLLKLPIIEAAYGQKVKDSIQLIAHKIEDKIATWDIEIHETINANAYNYINIEAEPSNYKQILTLSYGWEDNILGEFIFDLIPSDSTESYQIPLFTQLNWYKFNVNFMKLKSDKKSENMVLDFKLIKK